MFWMTLTDVKIFPYNFTAIQILLFATQCAPNPIHMSLWFTRGFGELDDGNQVTTFDPDPRATMFGRLTFLKIFVMLAIHDELDRALTDKTGNAVALLPGLQGRHHLVGLLLDVTIERVGFRGG